MVTAHRKSMTAVAAKGNASAGEMVARTDANRAKLVVVERVLREQIATALARGFYGVTAIELSINDGTIQDIRHRVERMER